jgi:hypothetical protein
MKRKLVLWSIWLAALSLATPVGVPALRSEATPPKPARKGEWSVLPPLHYQRLHVFPLMPGPRAQQAPRGAYITLDEGLKSGLVEVTETGPPGQIIRNRPPRTQGRIGFGNLAGRRSPSVQEQQRQGQQVQVAQQGAQVDTLWITNRSGKKLILLAGELVVGGKQDRIVQKDLIVPPTGKPFDLSVFCVEHGRWSGGTDRFGLADNSLVKSGGGSGGGLADPTVRGAAQAERKQELVWAKVEEKNSQAGVRPDSGTYQGTLMSDKAQRDAKPYVDAIAPKMPKNAVGAIIAIHGRIVWADAFGNSELFAKYWPKLLQSYIVDAVTTPPPLTPGDERIPRVLRNPPTVDQAVDFLYDWSGKSTFEGVDGLYAVTRIDGPGHVIFRLRDIGTKPETEVHFVKMRKR